MAPNDAWLHKGLRELFIIRFLNFARLKEFDRAIEVAERLTREYPSSPQGYAWLSFAHAQLGRRGEAIRALERALELDPENAQAHRELLRLRSGS